MSKTQTTPKTDRATAMAKRLGITRAEVVRAVNSLLYGNGERYRQVIDIPLHGDAK